MFKDQRLQVQFENDGFVIVPFLDSVLLSKLLEFFESVRNKHDITSPVHSTCDTNNEELIAQVDKELKDIVKQKIEEVFLESSVFLSNYLIKEADSDSRISPHQDWTFVDENHFASVSVWCPLTDINRRTGRISVISGSQRFIETLRASPDSPSAYEPVSNLLDKYLMPLELKAGEALIYNHALIHASEPNLSGKERPVAVWAVKPNEAELLLYYYHPAPAKRKLEQFSVDTDFFYKYAKHSRPNAKYSKGFVEYEFKQIDKESFFKCVGEITSDAKENKGAPSFLKKLSALLNIK